MPYERRSIEEINAGMQAQTDSLLPGTDPRLRRSFIGVLLRVVAAGIYESEGFIGWVARQIFPRTADGPNLIEHASLESLTRIPAKKATGQLSLSGTAATVVPAGTKWRNASGSEVESNAEHVLVGANDTVAVTAVTAGAAANAPANTAYQSVSPIAGLESGASASGEISGGSDIEDLESLRSRVEKARQESPRIGIDDDYVLWAKSADSSVTRAWCRPNAGGLGTVTVYIMTDNATANGIPTQAVTATVQSYVDKKAPVTADLTVSRPAAKQLNVTIADIEPDNATVKAAVIAELKDLLLREAEPGGTILLSHIRESISTAAGETDHSLTVPNADFTTLATQIAILGQVTWT